MARFLSAMMALAALLLVAVHPAAMATARASPASPVSVSAPCHTATSPAAAPAEPAPAKKAADCCDEGRCGGSCTPAGAFFRELPEKLLSFLRAALEAPVRAQAPLVLADARERPPKIGA